MQLDEFSVIRNTEANRTSDSNRHAEIFKARIIYIKKWHTELYLNDLGKVDEIHLSLKWCSALIRKPNNACKDREVCSFKNLIERTFNKILHGAVFLLVCKDGDFSILYA